MLPISSQPDMNSRATQRRSHRSRIRSPVVSKWSSLVEPADQAAQRRIGHRFIPMVKNIVEWRLTPHHPYDDAEDRRHPQQRRKASAEANAASVAKKTRMIMRRQKRTITWVDVSCCGRFGSCAKTGNLNGARFARSLGRGTRRSKPRHRFIRRSYANYRSGPARRADSLHAARSERWSCLTAQ